MKVCGATTRAGRPCKNKAGYKTDHVGQGRCHLHGGLNPIKHGRYSRIKRSRIRELIDEYRNDPQPLDLLEEVLLLRALLTDYVERTANGDQELDITAAAGLVDKVGRMVERIEKIKAERSITLETLDRVLEQLGVELVNALREEVADEDARAAILRVVWDRWHDIRVSPTAPARYRRGDQLPN